MITTPWGKKPVELPPAEIEVAKKPVEADVYINDIVNAFGDLVRICKAKRGDYATTDNPFENFQLSAEFAGIQTWQSIFTRLSEKFIRLSNLLKNDKTPQNESVEDSLKDLALLAVILLVYRKAETNEPSL